MEVGIVQVAAQEDGRQHVPDLFADAALALRRGFGGIHGHGLTPSGLVRRRGETARAPSPRGRGTPGVPLVRLGWRPGLKLPGALTALDDFADVPTLHELGSRSVRALICQSG